MAKIINGWQPATTVQELGWCGPGRGGIGQPTTTVCRSWSGVVWPPFLCAGQASCRSPRRGGSPGRARWRRRSSASSHDSFDLQTLDLDEFADADDQEELDEETVQHRQRRRREALAAERAAAKTEWAEQKKNPKWKQWLRAKVGPRSRAAGPPGATNPPRPSP